MISFVSLMAKKFEGGPKMPACSWGGSASPIWRQPMTARFQTPWGGTRNGVAEIVGHGRMTFSLSP
jgi:hypothetical protein